MSNLLQMHHLNNPMENQLILTAIALKFSQINLNIIYIQKKYPKGPFLRLKWICVFTSTIQLRDGRLRIRNFRDSSCCLILLQIFLSKASTSGNLQAHILIS